MEELELGKRWTKNNCSTVQLDYDYTTGLDEINYYFMISVVQIIKSISTFWFSIIELVLMNRTSSYDKEVTDSSKFKKWKDNTVFERTRNQAEWKSSVY
jgi:p-aminobenzoyl-glutamate transporter AbgT